MCLEKLPVYQANPTHCEAKGEILFSYFDPTNLLSQRWLQSTRIFAKVGLKDKKAKLSLCLTKHHAMKKYWGEKV
jgi:hypothetical protein